MTKHEENLYLDRIEELEIALYETEVMYRKEKSRAEKIAGGEYICSKCWLRQGNPEKIAAGF